MSRLFFHCLILIAIASCLPGCADRGQPAADSDPPLRYAPAQATTDRRDATSASTSKRADGSYEKRFGGIRFTIPAQWEEQTLSPEMQSFVEAKFTIPTSAGPAELSLTSMGGGIRANLDRWIDQVHPAPGESPAESALEIDGVEATWIDIRGTFQGRIGSGVESHENWGILGVAIPMRPRDFYLKLVGPREALSEVSHEFRDFAKSARIAP
jgi:hypothetical protein